MKVVCRGRLTIYPPRGQYQLDVFQVRPSGVGELQRAYEELYARLSAEGLFDEGRKRPIPKFPRTIGIITSETGAALQDMLTVLRRRYPIVRVVLRPAAVQGVGAELEIARAIQEFNLITNDELRMTNANINSSSIRHSSSVIRNSQRPDVLIVGRGGGSLEDLWSFNEEAVARAIFASKIPVISAVGHEVDFTIADFVADLRAPTPTAAAELATPNVEELMSVVHTQRSTLVRRMRQEISQLRRYVDSASDGRSLVVAISNTIHTRREQLNGEVLSASRSVVHSLERMRLKLERDTAKLAALHPDRVLDRGYTALETLDGEVIPKLSALLERGDKNGVLMFADGRITVRFD
jgi:exodeoxyribonuclease VII large subunit